MSQNSKAGQLHLSRRRKHLLCCEATGRIPRAA